jgi:hypothetical protein
MNEMVGNSIDRKYTSIWKSRNPNAPSSQREKKVYKELTYTVEFDYNEVQATLDLFSL